MHPKLIHPVEIVIAPIEQSETTYDADFGEVVGGNDNIVYGTQFSVHAQIKFYSTVGLEGSASGFEYKGNGYILVNIEDADKIHHNDKIVSIDSDVCEYYINDQIPIAQYDSKNFKKIFFRTKDKGKA